MESIDGVKQLQHATTPSFNRIIHMVFGIFIVAVLLVMQCQLADLRSENRSMKSQLEFLTIQLSTIQKNHLMKNFSDELDSSPHHQPPRDLVDSSAASSSSRRKRSATTSSESTRNRPSRKRNVNAAHFFIDDRLDAAAQSVSGNEGQSINYTGPNLKWLESEINRPRDSCLNPDKTSFTVIEDGVYFVYAQITYFNAAAKSTFKVEAENRTLLKCFQSVDAVSDTTSDAVDNRRIKTCFSAGMFALRAGEKLQLVNQSSRAIKANDKHANFWGLLRLHDLHGDS